MVVFGPLHDFCPSCIYYFWKERGSNRYYIIISEISYRKLVLTELYVKKCKFSYTIYLSDLSKCNWFHLVSITKRTYSLDKRLIFFDWNKILRTEIFKVDRQKKLWDKKGSTSTKLKDYLTSSHTSSKKFFSL